MRTICFAFLTIFSLAVIAAEGMTLNVDSKLPQFDITLPSNPTTGFQWTAKSYDKTFLQLTGSHYVAPVTRRIGAGGQMTFTFTRLKGKSYPQHTTLIFVYARSWAPNNGMMKQVEVNFTSQPNP